MSLPNIMSKTLVVDAARDVAPRDLPVHTQDLLGKHFSKTLELELKHGNTDLIKVLDILGLAGPFSVLSPWELQDQDGRHLINAGGYSALPFGEMYPPLISFLKTYLEHNTEMSLPQQAASTWRAALEANLIALLTRYAPSHSSSKVFFSNSGAEAIEAAIKFAKAARPKARTLINFTRAYHGKTTGALSLTPNEEYQAPFRPLMPNVVTLPYGDSDALRNAVKKIGAKHIVAIILEPIQGEAGVIIPPREFLPLVNTLCQENGILSIADEIQSGLGRSGYAFASTEMGLDPDIITLAKPLGGGLVPIGATITRDWIMKKSLGGLESKRHSTTFGGGSLAMAVGLKSLEIILEENLIERSKANGIVGLERLQTIQQRHPNFIKTVRGTGMLFALQLQPVVKLPRASETIYQLGTALAMRAMHHHGVHVCFTLNSSQVIRLTPALTMPAHLFEELFNPVEHAAQQHKHAWSLLPKTPKGKLIDLVKLALSK
jgi:acetylornithine/succinyldiaminopimelate/putrescine aminotransferase